MYALITVVSCVVGVLTGVFGFDGGILLFPFLLQLDFTLQQVIGILLFTNAIPNTLPGLWMYYQKGHILWTPALIIAASSTVGILMGSYVGLGQYSEKRMMQIYATILVFIGVGMFYNQSAK